MPPGTSQTNYLLVLAVCGLCSIVGFLWLRLEKSQGAIVERIDKEKAETVAALKDCESDRKRLWERIEKGKDA